MRTVNLSDHPGDMLRQVRQRDNRQRLRATSQYTYAVKQHNAEVRKAEAARDQARAEHRWLAWLRGVLAVRRIKRQAPTAPATTAAPSDEESKIAAGVEGERLAADDLGRALDDDWVLLHGYRNRLGEIDHLLVGPTGLVAIEVKNINGTVHCDGDDWRVHKFDKYGNLVEQYALVDRGKRQRSPSVQLNEPTDLLEDFLHSRGANVDVLRVVLLTHPRSKVGNCRRATVHVFTRASDIVKLVRKVPQPLDEARRTKIQDLITTDHRYHARRGGRGL